jgi:hypothetical protein
LPGLAVQAILILLFSQIQTGAPLIEGRARFFRAKRILAYLIAQLPGDNGVFGYKSDKGSETMLDA